MKEERNREVYFLWGAYVVKKWLVINIKFHWTNPELDEYTIEYEKWRKTKIERKDLCFDYHSATLVAREKIMAQIDYCKEEIKKWEKRLQETLEDINA